MLNSMLSLSVTQKASDLHLSSGEVARIRINGQLQCLSNEKLSHLELETELLTLLNQSQKTQLQQDKQIDLAYQSPKIGRFRVNIFYQQRGISAVFRIIKNHIPDLAQIGAPEVFKKLIMHESGIILVTGATGSGKSTTLASLIEHINLTQSKHIITLEDPIEFIYHNQRSLIQQRELTNFEHALDSLLRQDPDIILLGELRNKKAIQTALTIAETGHLVFATLHTCSAVQSINRIINVFDESSRNFIRTQLSNNLRAIISQQLVLTENGRKALFEILINTSAVSNLINEGKIKQIFSLMQTGQQYGMQVMPES
ncbi:MULTISPECIES: type IV pilus twitching motility protein PilT [unclassified Gilliamella]|uniref:type IV pilus twitching motility protein PilT n=1 Tax=unclassified Gilliamella TaxID=2685620 RepID=UPI00130C3F3D|nr:MULTISPECIES: PilT/PilU family type 4a pilus ATPase [unclassified Gilliamella]MWP49994.1 PilT/PilU family type 4a pilus ATPase [Gilliamella sp. Lep-s35]MWP69715.1 PilT/PilU family type 4a pilus ATPase [Gilliamella sp. Lep-s5]MWP78026.1 PilT/PilU family type 4a pilus ATPase [Gilliamella sp. Lep-s21]